MKKLFLEWKTNGRWVTAVHASSGMLLRVRDTQIDPKRYQSEVVPTGTRLFGTAMWNEHHSLRAAKASCVSYLRAHLAEPVVKAAMAEANLRAHLTKPRVLASAVLKVRQAPKRGVVTTWQVAGLPCDQEAVAHILAEVQRARQKFPQWPTDPVHAAAILNEESGEVQKAVLEAVYEPHKVLRSTIRTEVIQTAAMCLRFLASFDRYEWNHAKQHKQEAL